MVKKFLRRLINGSRTYKATKSMPYRFRLDAPAWECPVCGFKGRFRKLRLPSYTRANAKCPYCTSLERHRLQFLVLRELQCRVDFDSLSILHIAPEYFLQELFRNTFAVYNSADISARGVDFNFDLCDIPLPDASYDIVYASHVMEHIREDMKALSEIKRVLKPGGIAILPVPVVGEQTVEYDAPKPHEEMHVRAPALDYFERYRLIFDKVDIYSSDSFAERYQTWVYEDRTVYPTRLSPERHPVAGLRHKEYVPVCYVTDKHVPAGTRL